MNSMTYGRFHLIFNLPLLGLLLIAAGDVFWRGPLWPAGIVLVAVMIFTSPWDNYAVRQGIWGFPDGRYRFKIGSLPVEEYLFFVIESLQVMLLLQVLLRCWPHGGTRVVEWGILQGPVVAGLGVIFAVWVVLGLWGASRINRQSRFHYAWHLFFWFLPVVLMQMWIGWPVILPRLGPVLAASFGVGTWLALADWVAVRQGIWFFDGKQITGWKWKNILPWEEIAFFYLTAYLVAQSYVLLLPESAR